MRIAPFASLHFRNRAWPWPGGWVLAMIWCATQLSALAAEPKSERAARLGFEYDPKIREAAAAAKSPGGTLELEPPDPDVIRLPKYEVTERRIPLREDELLTPEGRVALAKKRYLTPMYQKVFGPLAAVASLLNNPLGGWNPNGPEAMAIYEDDLNLQRRKEMQGLVELATLAEQTKKEKAKASRGKAESEPPRE